MALGSEPDGATFILEQSGEEGPCRRNRGANLFLGCCAKSRHAILRGHPKSAIAILQQSLYLSLNGKGCQVVATNVADQAGGSPDPEASIPRRMKAPHNAQKCRMAG